LITVGSLFSGIGGIELGLERTGGFRTLWFVEKDPYCQAVLRRHWPGIPVYGDIESLGDCSGVERPNMLTGGFPCQPISFAGKRKGKEDSRWLWPQYLRTIRILRPELVLVENVPGLLNLGFSEVLGGLASCGYDAEWQSIRASDVGAPHRRERVFIVAYPDRTRLENEIGLGTKRLDRRSERGEASKDNIPKAKSTSGIQGNLADSNKCGQSETQFNIHPRKSDSIGSGEDVPNSASRRERVNLFSRRKDGSQSLIEQSDWWATEPDVGRVANGVPARVDRLRCLGNAVVPQCAQAIGEMILWFVVSTQELKPSWFKV
jgi:DNA (cytosine-5)-methyltransferase 1